MKHDHTEAMSKMNRLAHSAIINDELAEGASNPQEVRESADLRQTLTVPRVREGAISRAPLAETGLIAAVVVPAEGADSSDVQDASRTTAERQMTPQPAHENGARSVPSALIIEDTVELAEVLAATLQRMDITTAHESHGNRAFARYGEMNPDLVLLDISLPDVTGWKVLESIKERQRETGGRMPIVIVITAYGDPANRLVGKLHGVHSYLVKPFTAEEVEQVVRSALSGSPG
jgi:CheY-like chemotaxis protein